MIVSCSALNQEVIVRLLEKRLIAVCPYSIGFVDACLLASDYMLLVNYFGEPLSEEVLRYMEEQDRFEDCILLRDCLEEYKNNLQFNEDYML